jgi:hypothetical protein
MYIIGNSNPSTQGVVERLYSAWEKLTAFDAALTPDETTLSEKETELATTCALGTDLQTRYDAVKKKIDQIAAGPTPYGDVSCDAFSDNQALRYDPTADGVTSLAFVCVHLQNEDSTFSNLDR